MPRAPMAAVSDDNILVTKAPSIYEGVGLLLCRQGGGARVMHATLGPGEAVFIPAGVEGEGGRRDRPEGRVQPALQRAATATSLGGLAFRQAGRALAWECRDPSAE